MDTVELRFRRCFERSYDDLVRFVQRRTSPEQAEDVVADAFLVAWRRVGELPDDDDEARAWLFGIARNTMLNARRGAARRQALAVRVANPDDVADEADAVVERLHLVEAWNRLRPVNQEALALALWDDLTSDQAAAVLRISAVAYRHRLSRARRALRLHLALGDPGAPIPPQQGALK